ncbi:MAG TPA: hypothetical protein VHV82_09390 [Sporichthyaceae bacterium]|jgi:hypothetical protein|nr:hypothetical protein [Sporichthyaceae bacterium]
MARHAREVVGTTRRRVVPTTVLGTVAAAVATIGVATVRPPHGASAADASAEMTDASTQAGPVAAAEQVLDTGPGHTDHDLAQAERAARDAARRLLAGRIAAIEAETAAKAAEVAAKAAAVARAQLLELQARCGYHPWEQRHPDHDRDQLRNARTIISVARAMGLPPRAAVIALAAAEQESRLINMRGGDLDSAGLFQERPSAGWGTHRQVTDPAYATRTFYRVLLKVPGWQHLPVTLVAQAVEVSAFGRAYARWEASSAALVSRYWHVPVIALLCEPRPGGRHRADRNHADRHHQARATGSAHKSEATHRRAH